VEVIMAWLRIAPVLLAAVSLSGSAFAESAVEGAWHPEIYTLKDGTVQEVTGLIFFTDRDWTVLFFTKDGRGGLERGAGEGGTYTLEGDRLVFTHLGEESGGRRARILPDRARRRDSDNLLPQREPDDVPPKLRLSQTEGTQRRKGARAQRRKKYKGDGEIGRCGDETRNSGRFYLPISPVSLSPFASDFLLCVLASLRLYVCFFS
jgi:hypothetical protein